MAAECLSEIIIGLIIIKIIIAYIIIIIIIISPYAVYGGPNGSTCDDP